ncbi:MAG TPA: GAF domain-containing protein, partial [Actinomycetota bacterium]|nr:GAF domain-containing protein [Actinomycetota bacterium]
MARTATDHPELIPPDEEQRLEAVRRYAVLDAPPDGALDRIATLAARILHTPIASVTIVDEDRIWFRARHGLDATETERVPGLCASAILKDTPTIVTDAAVDPSTLSNPLVAGGLGLRFYAAAPLITSDGYRLGTLNVIDHEPRDISDDEVATLQDLAAVVVDELELRLA